jgi:predicted dehydrogenase
VVNVGVIGYGYWGPHLVRNLSELPNCRVAMLADLEASRREQAARRYPGLRTTADAGDLFAAADLDAVVIATPICTHFDLARRALEAGKHCLVEKPLAEHADEARELVTLAEQRNLVLMVGHTFLYNEAVRDVRRRIERGELGQVYYLYSQRLNLGKVQSDTNALWSLAPHDVSIFCYLVGGRPTRVAARGVCYIQDGIQDVVFLTLTFAGGVMAHAHVSWLDPNKVRRVTVVGSEKMVIYDDMADAKVAVYDKGVSRRNLEVSLGPFETFGQYQLLYRAGDVLLPKVNVVEPLHVETAEFIGCIESGRKPLADGRNGLDVVAVLEAAQRSLDTGGADVELNAAL